MTTPRQLHPDGDYFPGLNTGVVVIFTDARDRVKVRTAPASLWHGVVKRVKGSFTTGLSLSKTPTWISEFYVSAVGESNPNQGVELAVFEGTHKIVTVFTESLDGLNVGALTLTIGSVPSAGWYWLRPPANDRLAGQTDHETSWPDYEIITFLSDPGSATHHAFTLSAPGFIGVRETAASSRITIVRDAIVRASASVQVRNHTLRADTVLKVGEERRTGALTKIRAVRPVLLMADARLRIVHDHAVGAETAIQVRNHIVRAGAKIRVGRAVLLATDTQVRVVTTVTVPARAKIQVTFIGVNELKQDMQIQLGADSTLATETFEAIPALQGVTFFRNLQFALIVPGSETVRRMARPNETADGLYSLDYTQGRFAWLGTRVEEIEVTYRHSVSKITNENITAAIVKASAVIKDILTPGADIQNPRFVRGGIELAMSFLLDTAIWHAINAIGDFAGQSRRIDLLNQTKRDFERRAYETLAPFVESFSPGSPEPMNLVRPEKINIFDGE